MQKNIDKLGVSEYFYSLQGEGRTMGIPAFFIRLKGCNLMCGGWGTERDGQLRGCATWRCDTIEVWRRGKLWDFHSLTQTLDERFDYRQRLAKGAHLVITGGEPLMQQERIVAYLAYLEQEHGLRPIVEIETNACFEPLEALDQRVSYWNTSPKLSNSGMSAAERIYPEVLRWFAKNPKTMSKFVLAAEAEWEELQRDFLDTGLVRREQLVLMPAASSLEELLQNNVWLAELCIREQLRMCTRLHVEIWNQLTGK
jgi:organic radical activating enzyme